MFGIIAVIACFVTLLFLILKSTLKEEARDAEHPQNNLQECAIPPKETGEKTYEIHLDAKAGFQIMEVRVDPIDVGPEETQTITVWVRDAGNNTITRISGVSARIATDHGSITRPFRLTGAHDQVSSPKKYGTEKALITSWEVLWIREDTNCETYKEVITATNNEGDEASFELRFR